MDWQAPSTILITCAPGLVPVLAEEVRRLGGAIDGEHRTSVTVRGSMRDAMRLNLHLRTAFGVLYLLREFRARTPERLYNRVATIPWEEIIDPSQYFSVVSRVDTPAINNSMFPSLKVKDAIVDRIGEVTGRRPDSGPDRHRVVVNLYWKDDLCRVYVNTSGQKLSERGYRKMPHTAPMQEALAAGVVLNTRYTGDGPLINPMCGSGTIAIEAALIAQHRAPGLLRGNFGFMHVIGFDTDDWGRLRLAAKKGAAKDAPAPIIATDHDARAIVAARKNAMTAGVEQLIDFSVCDFDETPVPDGPGTVIFNPEYGRRLGDTRELEHTYERIGDFLKQRCAGGKGYVFTGSRELAGRIGLKTSRRVPMFNADIECRLLEFELYAGSRKTAAADIRDGNDDDCASGRIEP